MPTYDYRCNNCNHEFELFQSMKDSPKRKCPECGQLKLERLIGTGGAVIFKGGGFYETDYRSESYQKAADSDKKSAAGGDSKPEGAGDKQSDTKQGTKPNTTSDTAGASKPKGGTGTSVESQSPAPGGECQRSPLRPRPRVCSSARTVVQPGAPSAPSARARSLVEPTRRWISSVGTDQRRAQTETGSPSQWVSRLTVRGPR